MQWMQDLLGGFLAGLLSDPCSRKSCLRRERELRNHLSEKQVDRMIESSFPASDPPSTY